MSGPKVLATAAVALLVACSSPVDCGGCGGALVLEPKGIEAAGASDVTGYRVCLDGACHDLAPPERYAGPDQPLRTTSIPGTRPGQRYRSVTVTVLVGSRAVAELSGVDLAVPPKGGTACDCGFGILRREPASGRLIISGSY